MGGPSDYRHFLPRILELALSGSGHLGLDPPIIAGKLIYGGWTDWPGREREAIWRFFDSAFHHALDGDEAEAWLCALAHLGAPLAGYLQAWRDATNLAAINQLAHWVALIEVTEPDGCTLGAFWSDVEPAAVREVGSWLVSEPTRQQLAQALGQISDEDGYEIGQALGTLNGRI